MKNLFLIILILKCLNINSQSKKINTTVDERMELITTVQYLSGYFLLTQADINYTKDIDTYFKDYINHEVIGLIQDIQNDFFNFDKVPMIMYHYDFPGFNLKHEFSIKEQSQIKFEKNKDKIQQFFVELKDFYEVTNFHQFYKNHKELYNQLIENVQSEIEKHDIVKIMETHYGLEQQSYNIILTPLLHDGGFATRIQSNVGTDLFAIIGPSENSRAVPYFDPNRLLKDYIIHEFSHTFCNPLVDKFFNELEKDACLLNPIKEAMKKQAYSTWKSCLYEHLVRANEVILTEEILGSKTASKLYIDFYENGRFIYLRGLVPLIKKYKSNRNTYKNLEAFMPEIASYLHAEKEKCN